MNKVIDFFKNIWFRRGVSVLGIGYLIFLGQTAWLSLAYWFDYENATSLFVLYLFINLFFGVTMVFTRKQLITQIVAMLIPPFVFALVIFGFGNWFMIAPPFVVAVVIFFACRANETLKTVLGTFYLLMYVIGVVGYIGINLFMGTISFTDVDLSQRDTLYGNGGEMVSPQGTYRIVRYIDNSSKERRTASYYVEETENDMEFWFVKCKKVLGCQKVLTTKFTSASDNPVIWKEVTVDGEEIEKLFVEGVEKEFSFEEKEEEPEETTSKPSVTTTDKEKDETSGTAAPESTEE